MFELIYPDDLAPLLPRPNVNAPGDTVRSESAGGEFLPVIEPNGMVIGRGGRSWCHSGAKPLHPVVHLHVIDRYGRLWLQKRPMSKDIQPGKWDTAVGGHVDYGESVIEALYRETSEELGLREFNPIWLCAYEFESEVEREMVCVYAAVGSFRLKPDPDEVDEIRGWEMETIDENLGKSLFTPNFEGEFVKMRSTLLSLL